MNHLIFFIKKQKIIIFILILGLIPLIWFKDDFFLIHEDVIFPLYKFGFSDLINHLFSWEEQFSAGNLNIIFLAMVFPFYFFWALFRELGFSFLVIQKLWFIILFTLPGISMYYCVSVLNKGVKNINVLVASVFYMFNPFILIFSTILLWPTILVYGLTPLMFGLFVKGLETQNYKKYAILIGISSLFIASSAHNLATYSLIWFPILFYTIYRILLYKKLKEFLFLAETFLAVLLLNLYWIVGYIFFFLERINFGISSLIKLIGESYIAGSKLLYQFRLLGAAGWMESYLGSEYFPYSSSYNGILLIFTTFIPIIIIVFTAFKKLNKKYSIFFFIIMIIGFFLAKGGDEPFRNVFLFIYKKIPIFSIYRGTFYRFMPMVVFAYSILFGISTNFVSEGISRIKKSNGFISIINKVFVVFIIGIIFLNSWPLITGDVIPRRKGGFPGPETKVPSYWFEMSNYIDSLNRDSRIFILPQNIHLIYEVYNWGENSYYGLGFTSNIIRSPLISDDYGGFLIPTYTTKLLPLDYIYLKIKSNDSKNLGDLLSILGVQYILQRNDVDWTFFGHGEGTSPEQVKNVLSEDKDIYIKKSFGELDLYELSPDIILPHLYIAKSIIMTDGGIEHLSDIINSEDYLPRSVIFTNNQIGSSGKVLSRLSKDVFFIENYKKKEIPKITFIKINPTKYKIEVKNAKYPYILIFTENFNENWKLYINPNNSNLNYKSYYKETVSYFNGEVKEGTHRMVFLESSTFETWFKKPISEDRHLVANSYANSWYVEPNDVDGKENYELIIEFRPQRFYFLAIIVSALTLTVIIGYLFYSQKKLRRLRSNKS